MKIRSLGIALSRHRIAACLAERSLFGAQVSRWCSVACDEPFGGPGDVRRLAEEIRREAGGAPPPAVISIPPSWTYLRRLKLPAADLARARAIHLAALEGELPLGDEEIVSDLLPPTASVEPGRFLAIAARRSAVEKTAALFAEAGISPLRIVTDHVAALCAALAAKSAGDGILASFHGDIVVMRLQGGAVLWARQFPAPPPGAPLPLGLFEELRPLLWGGPDARVHLPLTVMGDLPAPVAAEFPGARRFALPVSPPEASPLAWGAALSASFDAETGGFSLRTSAEEEAARRRQRRRVRIAAAAGAVAIVSAAAALEAVRWAEGRKADLIRKQIRKEFNEAVPGVRAVVQETAQLKERIQSLDRQRKELGTDYPPPVPMLARVSNALPGGGAVTVREISYEAGRLKIDGDAAASARVEEFRAALSKEFGPSARVTVQESGGSRAGSVRFAILVEPEGGTP